MRALHAYTNCSAGVILRMKQSDKKVSFDDPQNGGHFSCRKPVSHVGTSTVSDSEALIHLAYVQHMWQSKFVVILEGLTRWNWIVFKDATSWEWLQMHFDIHVCLLEKFCYAALTAKIFANFAPFLDPKMEVEKWTQKWCKICKSFCCQSCIAKLFPANKHAYQNASVVISQLIASFNTIQSSTWSSLPK